MKKNIRWKAALIFTSVVAALFLFLPSTPLAEKLPDWWTRIAPKISLGLDLRGGSHVVMEVQTDKALESSVDNIIADLQTQARLANLGITFMREGQQIVVQTDNTLATIEFVKRRYAVLEHVSSDRGEVRFALIEPEAARLKEWAMTQTLERIRRRVDKYGVAEPAIYRQERDQIALQLPGVRYPEEAIAFIKTTGRLEFKLVDGRPDALLRAMEGNIPRGMEILYGEEVDAAGKIVKRPYLVFAQTLLTGERLREAKVSIDEFGMPAVSIAFDSEGARTFERITAENVGRQLAIILDGVVQSAPNIRERIGGGSAQISGNFTHDEAGRLAIVLRESLPAPIKVVQNLMIGPSLGQDSITAGMRAMLIGGVFVLLFMAFYYRLSGVIAGYAILLNLVLLLGAMALLNATLTLPGIAGIILTIGMGVDSSVLMFERIREELRSGKAPRPAVDAGYEKAFLTILDSNVTILITSAMLFLFGTGPIRGFAVTLSLGTIINMYSALMGTKVIFDIINARWKPEKLSI